MLFPFIKGCFASLKIPVMVRSIVTWFTYTEFFLDLFIYYIYNILPPCIPECQKRVPDLITDGCEPPCRCWELNSGPLEEQPVLLTTEPPLQPPEYFYMRFYTYVKRTGKTESFTTHFIYKLSYTFDSYSVC